MVGQHLSHPPNYVSAMPINSQRYFMRKEDYEMPKPHPDCLFKLFEIKCLSCGSFKLTLAAHYDDGDSFIMLRCKSCRQQETFNIKF